MGLPSKECHVLSAGRWTRVGRWDWETWKFSRSDDARSQDGQARAGSVTLFEENRKTVALLMLPESITVQICICIEAGRARLVLPET